MSDSPPARCAHCRKERAECEAAVDNYQWHTHWFSPTRREFWFDCPLCAEYRERQP